MWILPLILSLLLGYLWMRALLPRLGRGWIEHVLAGAFGAGFGIGVSASIYFLLLWAGVQHSAVLWALELAAIAAGALALHRRKGQAPAAPAPRSAWTWVLGLALLLAGALFLGAFWSAARANPQGDWDAWAIWNLRARFLAGGEDSWRHAISPRLEQTHSEYPLLTSAWIARAWTACGAERPDAVPIALALVFALATIALLVAAAAALRGLQIGLLAGLLLVSSTAWQSETSSLYADVPLGFYMLATIAAAAFSSRNGAGLPLAGCFAALAAWTKNEGLAFLAVAGLVVLVLAVRSRNIRSWLRFLAGALPAGLLAAGFQILLAPAGAPLLSQGGAQILHKLADPGRYMLLFQSAWSQALSFGEIHAHPVLLIGVLAAALALRRDQGGVWQRVLGPAAVGLQLGVYFGVLLLTSENLDWQLSTALLRLFVQLWPGLVLAVVLNLNANIMIGGRELPPAGGVQ